MPSFTTCILRLRLSWPQCSAHMRCSSRMHRTTRWRYCGEGSGGEGTRNTDPPSSSPSRDVVASNLVSHSEVCRFRVSKRTELADITMTMHAMHDQGTEDRFPGNVDISLFATYTRQAVGHNGFPIHRIRGAVSPCYCGRGFKFYTG